MFRRQMRERREFLYRKAEAENARKIEENRRKLREEAGLTLDDKYNPDSYEKQEANKLLVAEAADKELIAGSRDDEYKWAGVQDPKVLITTSYRPSSKLKEFAKEMKFVFPNAIRINRGSCATKDLVEVCKANEVTDLVILYEWRGIPRSITISHLPFGPTASFSLYNVIPRHDIPDRETVSLAYPHLIFHKFETTIGQRAMDILKYLFPVPSPNSKRVMTFANDQDYISFRHHIYKKVKDSKDIELVEVGPRFEMKLFRVVAGALDQLDTARVEFVHKHFLNTSYKRRVLAKQ